MLGRWCAQGCFGDSEMLGEVDQDGKMAREQIAMSDDSKTTQKITGYLEKRGKLTLMNSWKKYWFVLEGRLLLYYGSKEEYDALSPCKGSITLGPTCSIKPFTSSPCKFQITTTSGCVTTLRAETLPEQNKWMEAIFSMVNKNQKIDISPTRLCHFRYSNERVDMIVNNAESQPICKTASNSPVTEEEDIQSPTTPEKGETPILQRLQKMGARSYSIDSRFDIQAAAMNRALKKPLSLDLTHKDKVIMDDKQNSSTNNTATVSPRRMQFGVKIPKINKEVTIGKEKEEVIFEEDDFCVCSLEKNKDKVSEQNTDDVQRSISFSEARKVFNRNAPENTTSYNTKDKIIPETKEQDNNQRTKEQNIKDTNEDENSNMEDTKDNTQKQDQIPPNVDNPKNNIHNEEDIPECPNSKETLTSPISKKENLDIEKPIHEQERPSSYLDFRDNELYATCQEKTEDPHKSECEFTETSKLREDSLEFVFPPPPTEAYQSIDNLANEDDNDSLYEEDFVWQNEIYDSSFETKKTQSLKRRNISERSSLNEDQQKISEENIESNDDLYEEVDDDFVYRKPNELGEEYSELNYTRQASTNSVGSDIYEEVDVEKSKNNMKYLQYPTSADGRISNMYEEVNYQFSVTPKVNKKDTQIENDIYGANDNKKLRKNWNEMNKNKPEKDENEAQIDNELYSVINEKTLSVEMDNEIYAQPSQILGITSNKTENVTSFEEQVDNELYAIPTIENKQEHIQFNIKSKPILSKRNYESSIETSKDKNTTKLQENEIYSSKIDDNEEKVISNEIYNSFLENEIYTEPETNFIKERKPSVESDTNVYEDPDQLRKKPHKIEKKRKSQKSEDLKKQDNFIQRLLKQVTGKYADKEKAADLISGNVEGAGNTAETLKLLGDIQVLLEKKKKSMKTQMMKNNFMSTHRRVQSETNSHVKLEGGTQPERRTLSIDVKDDYSVVHDCVEDDEVIYSEVDLIKRSSKELKDLITDLLKHYKDTKDGSDPQLTVDKQ